MLNRMRCSGTGMKIVLVLLALMGPGTVAVVQENQVLPGDPRIDASTIRPGVDTFDVVMETEENRTTLYTLTRRIERDRQSGRSIVRVVQEYHSPSGASTDSSIVVARTLTPLSYASRSGDRRERFRWVDGRLEGFVGTSDDSVATATPVEGVFNAVVDDWLLASLPWGTMINQVQYRAVNPGRGVVTINARLAEVEHLSGEDREAWCWRIEHDTGLAESTLWIDATARDILLMRTELPDGRVLWKARSGWLPT